MFSSPFCRQPPSYYLTQTIDLLASFFPKPAVLGVCREVSLLNSPNGDSFDLEKPVGDTLHFRMFRLLPRALNIAPKMIGFFKRCVQNESRTRPS